MDTVDESNNGRREKRKTTSREHTAEEKRAQRKEWKKRKRETKKKARLNSSGDQVEKNDHEEVQVGVELKVTASQNAEQIVSPAVDSVRTELWYSRSALMLRIAQRKSQKKLEAKKTSFKPIFKRPETGHKEVPSTAFVNHSAGQGKSLKISEAKNTSCKPIFKRPETAHKEVSSRASLKHSTAKQPLPGPSRPIDTTKKQIVVKERKLELKEINPQNIKYLSQESVGSGSYGQCFRAHYRGINVVVKEMKHNDTAEDKSRAKRDLLHEAEVLTALGDHERLPLIVGVVTKEEPLCLVTQFHGLSDTSVTLHHAANTNMITISECLEIFVEICGALKHVHSKGFLHNDIKANNVVLERNSDKCTPVLIDFGKSTKLANLSFSANRKRTYQHEKSYLAPEVCKYRQYSTSSDVYSVGRMLKAVSKVMGFYYHNDVRTVVKAASMETPSYRPELTRLISQIDAIHL